MGKEVELWDDSALVNAFDAAVSKYKKMHSKKSNAASTSADNEKSQIISSTEEAVSYLTDQTQESNRNTHVDYISDVATTSAIEMGKPDSPSMKDHPDDSSTLPNIQPPKDPYKQGAVGSSSNSEGVEEYGKLLNKYYELEEQRQKVLQELQQLGSWNYQDTTEVSGSCADWSAYSSQGYQPPANYASNSTAVCSCCPYGCQLVVAPCTALPNCSRGGTCDGKIDNVSDAETKGRLSLLEDKDIVKTAMGAAEKAMSTMKTQTSEPEGLEKNVVDGMAICTSSETDFTAVLNAWYSAGFYTAKYLMEQSIANKRQG